MPDLKIEVVARNELGLIVALITPDGIVDAHSASADIARGHATYVTGPDSFTRVPVRAITAIGGAYLYANWDGSQRNNLNDLAAVRVSTISRPPSGSNPGRSGSLEERLSLKERSAALWGRFVQRFRMPAQSTRGATCIDCGPA